MILLLIIMNQLLEKIQIQKIIIILKEISIIIFLLIIPHIIMTLVLIQVLI
jgi:hypothetical protein